MLLTARLYRPIHFSPGFMDRPTQQVRRQEQEVEIHQEAQKLQGAAGQDEHPHSTQATGSEKSQPAYRLYRIAGVRATARLKPSSRSGRTIPSHTSLNSGKSGRCFPPSAEVRRTYAR